MEFISAIAPKKTAIRRSLLRWYSANARKLPWRQTHDPYRIWVSEIMLQQTRAETVIPYYRRFLRAFPTVDALAAAPLDEVLKLWEGLGYYSRARNLHAAAKLVVAERASRLPSTADQLRRLPGIGRYSAGAIASIAFGEAAPVLDGNVKRVLARLGAVGRSIDAPAVVKALWRVADELVTPHRPGDFNQAMMELGARICTPRRPDCPQCPLRRQCDALADGLQHKLPVRRKPKNVPHYPIVAAAIVKRGRYLLGQRPPDAMLGGLWEFPGGKIARGETHAQALKREVAEEVGLSITVGERIARVEHAYSHFRITLYVYRCTVGAGRRRALYHTRLAWVPPSQFDRYAVPAANRSVLNTLSNS